VSMTTRAAAERILERIERANFAGVVPDASLREDMARIAEATGYRRPAFGGGYPSHNWALGLVGHVRQPAGAARPSNEPTRRGRGRPRKHESDPGPALALPEPVADGPEKAWAEACALTVERAFDRWAFLMHATRAYARGQRSQTVRTWHLAEAAWRNYIDLRAQVAEAQQSAGLLEEAS